MGKGLEQTSLQIRYTNGQQAYEMMLKITRVGEDVKILEHLYITGLNLKWYSY